MDEQQIINEVAEVAENVVPPVVETIEIVKNNPILLVGVGVAGLAIGAASGYFFAKRRLEELMRRELDEKTEAALEYYKDYYQKVNKVEKYATASDAAAALLPDGAPVEVVKALEDYTGASYVEPDEEVVVEVQEILVTEDDTDDEPAVVERRNVFVDGVLVDGKPISEEDYPEYDDAAVDLTKPHIVSKDAFFMNEHDDEQVQITYYAGDDVLADENDDEIGDSDDKVGDHNLKFFGHLSEDINIVYIRNPELGLSFEVARSAGKYSKEVQGFEDPDELRHEDSRRRTRRWDDD